MPMVKNALIHMVQIAITSINMLFVDSYLGCAEMYTLFYYTEFVNFYNEESMAFTLTLLALFFNIQ